MLAQSPLPTAVSADKTCRVTACIQDLTGNNGAVRSVAFSPDGARAATSSEDQTIKVPRLPPSLPHPPVRTPPS